MTATIIGVVFFVLALVGLISLGFEFRNWRYRRRIQGEIVPTPFPQELISIIIPFQSEDPVRLAIFDWVYRYWRNALPDAEIIVAGNGETPFHKTRAVNDGVARSHGDILVIMDGDCYMSALTITALAGRIRQARSEGRKLWYIPYRRFYRLTKAASEKLLFSSPEHPLYISDPPLHGWAEHVETSSSGHWWGALIQVMPREAFVAADGMDLRFQGWGGEDVSFMHKVDTLWGKHKTFNGPVFHIWHPVIPGKWKHTRQWEGQPTPEMNDALSTRYEEAIGDPERMRRV
jgi:hypothetical protein